jgi:SAM-dependent methyltransferase
MALTTKTLGIAAWAWSILGCPGGRGGVFPKDDRLVDAKGLAVGNVDNGLVRFGIRSDDPSVKYYRSIGGAHFHERSATPYAMSALDAPLYREYLRQIAPSRHDSVIVDVGGGDGRNALPWLEWGYKKIVVVDAVAGALRRFRERVAAQNETWLDRLLLIEADARALPLRTRCADRVLAIESLYYLNEDYELGLGECRRIMRPDALLLVSDRDYEAGLLTRLLSGGGLDAMIEMGEGREVWEETAGGRVRSRCFTLAELKSIAMAQGLRVIETHGVSIFSLIVGFLSQMDRLGEESGIERDQLDRILSGLGRGGAMRRTHVLIAGRGSRRGSRTQPAGRATGNQRR